MLILPLFFNTSNIQEGYPEYNLDNYSLGEYALEVNIQDSYKSKNPANFVYFSTTVQKSICMHEGLRHCCNEALFWINNSNTDEQNSLYMKLLKSIQYKHNKTRVDIKIFYYKSDNFIKKVRETCPNVNLIELDNSLKDEKLSSFCVFDRSTWMQDTESVSHMSIYSNYSEQITLFLNIFNHWYYLKN